MSGTHQEEGACPCRQCGEGRPLTRLRIRNDLPVTFLSEPEEYEGRELVVGDLYISREIQLETGDLVLYPASRLHLVCVRYAGHVFFPAAEHVTGCPRLQSDLRCRYLDPGPGGATWKR